MRTICSSYTQNGLRREIFTQGPTLLEIEEKKKEAPCLGNILA